MKRKSIQLLLAVALATLAAWAQAAVYTCSIGAPTAFSATYSTSSNANAALSIAVTCVKTGSGGGTTIVATVTPNNGGNPSGNQNRATATGTINYDLYTDATCATLWPGSGNLTFTFSGGGGSTQTQTVNYYGCVPSAQPLLPAANTFTDTVSQTLALPTPGGATITGTNPQTFGVSITVPAVCKINPVPGSVNFGTYVAFGSALTANTTFGVTCNDTLTYGLDIGTTGGVVGGNSLYYTLGINTTASGGSTPLNGLTGNGIVQSYFINGTMPAGQAGTCASGSCPNQTETRTLTVTY
ncbi:MAG: spore coat protein U domain-containing protein [Betaproteobacteria bacterium]|nr:spore coat protein U domain-containing protein [Betaproteobacteria bacterium]